MGKKGRRTRIVLGALGGAGDVLNKITSNMLALKLQDQQRQKELQDKIEFFRKQKEIEKEFMPYDMDTIYKQMQIGKLGREAEQERKLGVMTEQETPSPKDIAMFLGTPETQKQFTSRLGPTVEGGFPMYPEGATFNEGYAYSPKGEIVGEYTPGQEPVPLGSFANRVPEMMRAKFSGGIPKEELVRKFFGMSKGTATTGKVTQLQVVNLAKNLAQAENPMAGEGEIQAKIPVARRLLETNSPSESEFTSEQEQLIQDNMTAYPDKTEDEIIEALRSGGYL